MNSLLFEHFKRADEGSYLGKAEFYRIKKIVLISEGVVDGYDIQIAEKKCPRCFGRGYQLVQGVKAKKKIHFTKVECIECNSTGISANKEWYLLRYLLNDGLFHLSTNTKPPLLKLCNVITEPKQYKPIDPADSYYSLALLILYTEPDRFDYLTKFELYPPLIKLLETRLDELVADYNQIRQIEITKGVKCI